MSLFLIYLRRLQHLGSKLSPFGPKLSSFAQTHTITCYCFIFVAICRSGGVIWFQTAFKSYSRI